VELADDFNEKARALAEQSYPNEACALLVGVGKRSKFFACRNISTDPTSQFLIHPDDYIAAESAGDIIGLWHSHTNTNSSPSEIDIACCEAMEVPWIISSIWQENEEFKHGPMTTITPLGEPLEYVGRPYVFGQIDCYSLTVDFYKREFGIVLPPFKDRRIDFWWKNGTDYFGNLYKEQGFQDVEGEWKRGDVVMFGVGSDIPNHVAIYLGAGIILHHVVNRLSRREECSPYWSEKVVRCVRHKDAHQSNP
jgi:proteasome lid subunit RPN8/RPN11